MDEIERPKNVPKDVAKYNTLSKHIDMPNHRIDLKAGYAKAVAKHQKKARKAARKSLKATIHKGLKEINKIYRK